MDFNNGVQFTPKVATKKPSFLMIFLYLDMLADSEAVIIVRNWIENISKIAFDEISVLSEEVENCDFNRVDINCNFENIKKIIEEDDKIEYKDGSKYIGDIEENKPHGEGQITLSDGRIYCGNFTRGRLEGRVVDVVNFNNYKHKIWRH